MLPRPAVGRRPPGSAPRSGFACAHHARADAKGVQRGKPGTHRRPGCLPISSCGYRSICGGVMHEQSAETEPMLAVPLQERRPSASSLRPVDLAARANDQNRTYETLSNEWDMSERRRRLARIVIGAVAACVVILAAAAVRAVAGMVPSSMAASAPHAGAISPAEPTPPSAPAPNPGPTTPAEASPTNAPPMKSAAPTMGTLTLEHPAAPGHVWFDGERLTAEHATVACGKHEVRVGLHGHAHSIDVPCGGDIHVSR
jgi:hypothetical protein